jgi:major membrane immunogen (membrane-anchored lipoprotein)
MRKYLIAATLAMAGTLALSACNKQEDNQQTTQQATAAKPTNPNDAQAWNAYLGQIVQNNMQGMTAERPYAYLVPAGDDADAKAKYDRQMENVQDTIARGVLPGNLLAFAGPSSAKTADFVIAAFKDAKPGSFKDVIVLFIGDQADKDRVTSALQPTGANVRFVAM